MKKRASFLAALGATLFGVQPASAQASVPHETTPQTRHVEHTRVETKEQRAKRLERERYAAMADALSEYLAREQPCNGSAKANQKRLRWLQKVSVRLRNPETFERAA